MCMFRKIPPNILLLTQEPWQPLWLKKNTKYEREQGGGCEGTGVGGTDGGGYNGGLRGHIHLPTPRFLTAC